MRIELANTTTTAATGAVAPEKDAAQHAKLVDAAQQFEGMLLEQMLKGMQDGTDGEDSGGGANDTLRSFGTEAVARAIAKGGGVGIAKQVVAKVTHETLRQNVTHETLRGAVTRGEGNDAQR